MYLCHCRGVTDGAIRAAVARGARDVATVGARCNAGTKCGGCLAAIQELLARMDDAASGYEEAAVA